MIKDDQHVRLFFLDLEVAPLFLEEEPCYKKKASLVQQQIKVQIETPFFVCKVHGLVHDSHSARAVDNALELSLFCAK